jgi:hypothetical protein
VGGLGFRSLWFRVGLPEVLLLKIRKVLLLKIREDL